MHECATAQTPGEVLVQRVTGRGNSKKLKELVKAGIQGTASLNSEGIEGFPLSLSLRCPSTFIAKSSHLGSGASLDGARGFFLGISREGSRDSSFARVLAENLISPHPRGRRSSRFPSSKIFVIQDLKPTRSALQGAPSKEKKPISRSSSSQVAPSIDSPEREKRRERDMALRATSRQALSA